MTKKLSNDENIANLKKRKILRYFIIFFAALTMVLAILSLIIGISILYALGVFIIVRILTHIRDNTTINKSDKITEVEKEINKVKKRKNSA